MNGDISSAKCHPRSRSDPKLNYIHHQDSATLVQSILANRQNQSSMLNGEINGELSLSGKEGQKCDSFSTSAGESSTVMGGEVTSSKPRLEYDEVKLKPFIEKEYVHVQDISYSEVKDKNQSVTSTKIGDNDSSAQGLKKDKKRRSSPFRWVRNKNNSSGSSKKGSGNSLPTSPERSSEGTSQGRTVRSTTMPSEMVSGAGSDSGPGSPIKKSGKKKSKSITSFFSDLKRKMSPKTHRKHLTPADQLKSGCASAGSMDSSFGGSLEDSFDRLSVDSGDHSGTPTHKPHKSKATKGSPIKHSDSSKKYKSSSSTSHMQSVQPSQTQSTSGTQDKTNGMAHPMPSDSTSTRILKSIEDNLHIHSLNGNKEKSVYQAFKDKQSPKILKKGKGKEALSMKSQALKVVDIPDTMLNRELGHGGEGHGGEGHVDIQRIQGQAEGQGEITIRLVSLSPLS